MSASASINPSTSQLGGIATGSTAGCKKVCMRETFTLVRDIIIVLGLQAVFRTMMLLRKLNY
ncbi:MAG TPA: hypothetical protein VGR97_03560 [Candidatus Acidoferrales bacterium]|nr:hypothetical protein [Candidatus Acidoferrales bacterium]